MACATAARARPALTLLRGMERRDALAPDE
jgi:hypothetical protein